MHCCIIWGLRFRTQNANRMLLAMLGQTYSSFNCHLLWRRPTDVMSGMVWVRSSLDPGINYNARCSDNFPSRCYTMHHSDNVSITFNTYSIRFCRDLYIRRTVHKSKSWCLLAVLLTGCFLRNIMKLLKAIYCTSPVLYHFQIYSLLVHGSGRHALSTVSVITVAWASAGVSVNFSTNLVLRLSYPGSVFFWSPSSINIACLFTWSPDDLSPSF